MELETIIGLEIHAQLSTKTKLFCNCDNDAFGAEPNTRICPVCMGFPGMLPVLNQEALNKGVKAAAALDCEIKAFSKFDRKNYFYPDLPSGYQISQFDQPISENGKVTVDFESGEKSFGITRVHLENDAGKLVHTHTGTLCDYNRAGSPLIEIVTEPDLRTPKQAQMMAKEIQKVIRAVGASDADMEKGMMRFDASISMRPKGEDKLYPRSEIKNLNSFSALLKALQFEQKRQRKLWEEGNAPDSESTISWDDEAQATKFLRDKESATDYRYFPEPDLPPMTFTEKEIQSIYDSVEELPRAKFKRYQEDLKLTEAEALRISEEPDFFKFFEEAIVDCEEPRKIANLFLSSVIADTHWKKSQITPVHLKDVYTLQSAGTISSSASKEIIAKAMETGDDAEKIMQELGLEQKSNTDEIETWVDTVIEENPKVVEEIKDGKDKGIQFLMGQVMKLSRGSANPPMVMQILKKKLGN